MSMQIKFVRNPKGIMAVDAEPGTIRWVSRPLALRLVSQGFAEVYAPTEHGRYETAAVAPEEKGVIGPDKPKKRGKSKKEEKKEPVEPAPPAEPGPSAEPENKDAPKTEPTAGSEPKEPPAGEAIGEASGVPEDPPGLSGIPPVEEVFGKE